jgi:hypothetical protein
MDGLSSNEFKKGIFIVLTQITSFITTTSVAFRMDRAAFETLIQKLRTTMGNSSIVHEKQATRPSGSPVTLKHASQSPFVGLLEAVTGTYADFMALVQVYEFTFTPV